MQNIGITFVKLDQYNDAITSFEHIMGEEPDFQTGFNLILCYYALADREKMKRTFIKLLSIDLKVDDEDKYVMSNVSIRAVTCCAVQLTLSNCLPGLAHMTRFDNVV